MLEILEARLQQYMNQEIPDVQGGFRKDSEPEIKLPTSAGSVKRQENSRKASTYVLLITQKPLTVWIATNWKISSRDGRMTWRASWEICMQVKKQQLGADMEQQTGSK